MIRRAVVLIALFAYCVPAVPQHFAVPIQAAQAAPTQELPPQPPPPPKKPATATPPEDTGMAGQVAETGVVVPPVAPFSSVGLLTVLGILAAAALAGSGGGGGEDHSTGGGTTGTR